MVVKHILNPFGDVTISTVTIHLQERATYAHISSQYYSSEHDDGRIFPKNWNSFRGRMNRSSATNFLIQQLFRNWVKPLIRKLADIVSQSSATEEHSKSRRSWSRKPFTIIKISIPGPYSFRMLFRAAWYIFICRIVLPVHRTRAERPLLILTYYQTSMYSWRKAGCWCLPNGIYFPNTG